jgi:aminoglycoside phosphotransferase (APT) family kinase protein
MGARGHLAPRDAFTRQMIARVTDEADPTHLTQVWEAALALPPWQGQPHWIHADLHPLNLLTTSGRIAAVIDWGGLCVGDPAHDLICAWAVLPAAARSIFREALGVDAPTWARARALAFSKAVMAVPYYRNSNPPLRDAMRLTLHRTLADWPT